jgi:hypothetical protein
VPDWTADEVRLITAMMPAIQHRVAINLGPVGTLGVVVRDLAHDRGLWPDAQREGTDGLTMAG